MVVVFFNPQLALVWFSFGNNKQLFYFDNWIAGGGFVLKSADTATSDKSTVPNLNQITQINTKGER